MRLVKIICLLSLIIMAGTMLVNCSSSGETSTPEPSPMQTEPDFIGDIIDVDSIGEKDVLGTILVEGKDVIKSSDKYVITVKKETLIFEQDGQDTNNISFVDLKLGQKVQIWFSGPVAESYPAQVDAAQVMIVSNQNVKKAKLGEEFQMTIGQRVEFSDAPLDIIFKRVTEDSRCPRDVTCVWQGEVRVEIESIGEDGSHTMTLTQPGGSYAGYEIAFEVLPYPESDRQIEDDEYRLVMKVTKEAKEITGTLKGHVTIGPIEPVVHPGDNLDDVPPEIYDARKIMVYDASGEELMEEVDIGHDGNYSVELTPGIYLIDINNQGIDYSNQVPVKLEILEAMTVQLDIDIDTGIR